MRALARWSVHHRVAVVLLWLAVMAGSQLVGALSGGNDFKSDFNLPGTDSQKVFDLLADAPTSGNDGISGQIVLSTSGGNPIASAGAGLQPALQSLCAIEAGGVKKIYSINSPFGFIACKGEAPAKAQPVISPDGSTAIAELRWDTNDLLAPDVLPIQDALDTALAQGVAPGVSVNFGGDAFALLLQQEGFPPFLIGFLAALLILVVVFRNWLAILPIATAIAALVSTLGLTAGVTHLMSVAEFAPALAELMVIGVGVDYALFIVSRHRRNLRAGVGVTESILKAIDTSGRAVIFAGLTVCVALLGLCLLGVKFLYGPAVVSSMGVVLTMAASVTLLPALLSFFGLKALTAKDRKALAAGGFEALPTSGFWTRWSAYIQRSSLLPALASVIVLVLLALPFFGMRLGHADQGNDLPSSTTRQAYDTVANKFGAGYNNQMQLVVRASGADTAKIAAALPAAVQLADPGAVLIVPPAPAMQGGLTFLPLIPTMAPQSEATDQLISTLRGRILPAVMAETGATGEVLVFGNAPVNTDFAAVLTQRMPLFFAAIIGLSFLLLMIAFRSLLVPAVAALMNLVAAAASFGVVVAIFQNGFMAETLGIGKGPIEAFIPVMMFAILFGLSMDYQVFLVSSMHEEFLRSGDNGKAVREGQARTGGIITAAALIMVMVFLGFTLDPNRFLKMFGIGLATAVFLDAFILRTVLVPAVMHLLGRRNWYFPQWLEWVPKVSIEGGDDGGDDGAEGKAAALVAGDSDTTGRARTGG
ncbi:MMPL family transporter [Nakamurella antarctica]|uniref:MMPL family transporter n=1 Tax=Nakamurella antarctica TaxID=1902245 RepID=A0A3G8ZI09_9ACTN|nr:MMPL family transporter [Nakamurella antarctica]AZI56830.1 MMPL family transporter [Nakamurella antarctica]